MDPTACYVKVYVTGFTPGPHVGTLDSNAGQVAITVEVGADGTGDWKSASPIVQVGEGVTATVDGLASAKTLVTC